MGHTSPPTRAKDLFADWGEGSRTARLLRKVRVALTPRSQLLAARLSNGAVVYGRNRAGFGGRGAYIFRDSLEPELYHLQDFLPDEGVFIDVGANTGVFSLKAARHFGGTRGVVVSLEPFPETMAVLFHSMRRNGFTNMRVRNMAAGAETGTATFYLNNALPNMFGLKALDAGADSINVMEVRLDDLFAWEKLDRLDFLKVDAEDAEEDVLSGAWGIITRYRPILCVENWLDDLNMTLPEYRVFRKGGLNRLYIPRENPKAETALRLGYREETAETRTAEMRAQDEIQTQEADAVAAR